RCAKPLNCTGKVADAKSQMVNAWASFFQKPRDSGVGIGWFQQFNTRARREHGDVHPFFGNSLPPRQVKAKLIAVEPERVLNAGNRDTQMIDDSLILIGQPPEATARFRVKNIRQQLPDPFSFRRNDPADGSSSIPVTGF